MYRKVIVLLTSAVVGCVLTTGVAQVSAAAVCVNTTPIDSYAVNAAMELSSTYSDPAQEVFSVGQSFLGTGVVVDSASISLSGDSGIVGNAYVEIRSHTGTFGVDGLPDAVLATSDLVDETTMTTAATLIKFNFSGANRITLVSGTSYFIVVNVMNQSIADVNAYAYYQGSYPTEVHSGNIAYIDPNTSEWWVANSAGTLIFEVLGDSGTPCVPSCIGVELESSAYRSGPTQGLFSVGQSFIGTRVVADSAKFSLSGSTGIAGNAYVEIRSHTGTLGVDGLPDIVLATSDLVNESVLTTGATSVKFVFSGTNRITLVRGTNYYLVVNIVTQGAANKFGYVYYRGTYPSLSYLGNTAYFDPCTSQWTVGKVAGALVFEMIGAPETGNNNQQSKEEKKDQKKIDKEEKKIEKEEKKDQKKIDKEEKKEDKKIGKEEKKDDKSEKKEDKKGR